MAESSVSVQAFREGVRARIEAIYRVAGISEVKKNAFLTEKGIHDYTPTTDEATPGSESRMSKSDLMYSPYYHRCAQVLANIDPSSYVRNADLIKRLRDKKIDPVLIGRMTPAELVPSVWAPLESRLNLERSQDDTAAQMTTDTVTCRRCKRSQCAYYQLQTRSSDEPITTFFTCLHCHNQWRD